MNEGNIDENLVPDDFTSEIIGKAIDENKDKKIMFDGFPRNEEQAKKLDEMLAAKGKQILAVIYLEVPDERLVDRATGRRIHQASGRSYHITNKPPKEEGIDDVTGEPLIQREDDKEETVKKRLETFHANNKKILGYYEPKGILKKVNSDRDINEIKAEVIGLLKSAIPTKKQIGRASCRERVSSPV